MTPLGVFARGTPGSRTPETGTPRVQGDAEASRAIAQALATLVGRLESLGTLAPGTLPPAADGTVSMVLPGDAAPGDADAARADAARADAARADVARADAARADAALVAVRDALRLLTARSRDGALLLRMEGRTLLLDGVPVSERRVDDGSDALLARLAARLESLGVGSLTIREGAAPGELLTLARWLARPRQTVIPAAGSPTLTTPGAALAAAISVGVPVTDTPVASPAVAGPADAGDASHDERPRRELHRSWSVLVMPASVPAPERPGNPITAAAMARLAAARSDAAATAAVNALVEALDDAERRDDAAAADGIARAVLAAVRSAGGAGRVALESALRRLQTPRTLALLVRRLPDALDVEPVVSLLARAGDASVAVLVEALLTAEDATARRVYFDAIVAMDVGATILFEALTDPRWYVVRNAAALLGEMGIEHADVALQPLLGHPDERIRIAATRALLRLRTTRALAGVQRMVDDPHPELRRLAAAAYGLAGALPGRRPPVGPLATALDRERDDDVALEMLAALGRLGSSDAVQRLLRIALPAPADLTGVTAPPRASWMRIAAMEALVRARGAAMIPAIEGLRSDADPDVSAAAARLLR